MLVVGFAVLRRGIGTVKFQSRLYGVIRQLSANINVNIWDQGGYHFMFFVNDSYINKKSLKMISSSKDSNKIL